MEPGVKGKSTRCVSFGIVEEGKEKERKFYMFVFMRVIFKIFRSSGQRETLI